MLLFMPNTGMGMKRPAEEDYNSNVHAKRSKDEEDGPGQSTTLRFLLESKVGDCKTMGSVPDGDSENSFSKLFSLRALFHTVHYTFAFSESPLHLSCKTNIVLDYQLVSIQAI